MTLDVYRSDTSGPTATLLRTVLLGIKKLHTHGDLAMML